MNEPWRTCRECAAQTGRCAAHLTWFEIIPAITIPAETVIPTETITVPSVPAAFEAPRFRVPTVR